MLVPTDISTKCKSSHFLTWSMAFLCLAMFFILPTLLSASEYTSKTIISASEASYPPFCVKNSQGNADGFSVELLRAALLAMGRDVSFDLGPWSKVKQSLVDREVQVLPLVGRTPEREEVFDFTFPYMTMHGAIVVRSSTDNIHSMDDLGNKHIAVMKGDNAEEFVRRKNMYSTITTTETFDIALQELSDGKYDAVIIQKLLAIQLMKKHKITNLKIVGPPLSGFVQSFCFAVSKGNSQLLKVLNEGLSIVLADGTFDALRKKWFSGLSEPSKSRIVIGGDYDYPPYEYLDENEQPTGFNVDLTRAIARQLGVSVDIRLGPWGEVRKKLRSSEIDMVQGMFYSLERDKDFDFAEPNVLISHVFVARKGTDLVENLAGLAGKIIVVMDGDIMHDLAVKAGYSRQLILVKTQREALWLVSNGEAEYALLAKIPAYYWMEKEGISNLTIGSSAIIESEYCYAAKYNNSALIDRFSMALAGIKADGSYRKIYNKWLGVFDDDRVDRADILKYSLYVLIPVICFILLSFIWVVTLRRLVKTKTEDLVKEVYERGEIEKQLHTKHKFEAIGQLSGGVAHDFNNLLTIIYGYSELIINRTNDDSPTKRDVGCIVEAAKRAENLTRQLLAFSRKQKMTPKTVDLNVLLSGFEKLLRKLLREKVQLKVEILPSPVLVLVDPAQIEQVLINLVTNARDAIGDEKGEITITTGIGNANSFASKNLPIDTASPFGLLVVEDTGSGIPEDIRQEIFDPFFSTKEQGKGTGLGLSTVYGIVRQSGGYVFVDSDSRTGAKFSVLLPVGKGKSATKPLKTKSPQHALLSKTILVVDDESSVRAILCQILEGQGCCVLAADNAGKAIELWKDNSDKIDLLLTDVGMPGMSGIALVEKLLSLNGDLKVIFMSGYSEFHSGEIDVSIDKMPFLQKPIDPERLITMTSRVLSD